MCVFTIFACLFEQMSICTLLNAHDFTCRSLSMFWLLLLFLKQATPATFDCVLVAPRVEEDDQKAQRQSAFIQELEKKNIAITVSLSTVTLHSNTDSMC